jgi:ketosteroid isomerase-like protein
VRLLNDTTALATCSFHFDATNVGLASGKVQERHITHGRATHVFQLDEAGKLLIVHEHLSSSDIRKD